MQHLLCVSNGDIAVLHWAIDIFEPVSSASSNAANGLSQLSDISSVMEVELNAITQAHSSPYYPVGGDSISQK